jgi:cytochrome c
VSRIRSTSLLLAAVAAQLIALLSAPAFARAPTWRDHWEMSQEHDRQRRQDEQQQREHEENVRVMQQRAADRKRLEDQLAACGQCPERASLQARIDTYVAEERAARMAFCSVWLKALDFNPAGARLVARLSGYSRVCEAETEPPEAVQLVQINFDRAMASDDADEVERIGAALGRGDYGRKDAHKSASANLRAARLRGGRDGYDVALARYILLGHPAVPQDPAFAIGLLLKLAERGYTPAMAQLGFTYCRGPFPPSGRNAAEAEKWISRHSARPDADPGVLFNFAELYLSSDCFDRDLTKARSLLQAAADRGFVHAQRKLQELPAAAPIGTPPSAAATSAGIDLARSKNCLICHQVDRKLIGPAWVTVAARYAGQGDAEARLAKKIVSGGSGSWGSMPMPAQANVTPSEATQLARWVLGLR